MASDGSTKVTRPNPQCVTCRHGTSFHAKRDPTSKRRQCKAFACECKNFKPAKET